MQGRLVDRQPGDGGLAGLVIAAGAAWQSWRPVPVPISGPVGDGAGQAPPFGLAVRLGDLCHGQRHAQLVVLHLDSGVVGVSGRHATGPAEGGASPEGAHPRGRSPLPGRPWWYTNVHRPRSYNGRSGSAALPDRGERLEARWWSLGWGRRPLTRRPSGTCCWLPSCTSPSRAPAS